MNKNVMKIMKRTINAIAIALVSTGMLTGCSDSFLTVESYTDESIETYFTTDEAVQEAVVAAYGPLQWSDWTGEEYNPVTIMSDIMADDLWVGGANATDNQFWHLMMNYEALPNNCMTSLWWVAYSGIKRCNDVITYIGWAADDITDDDALYYEAQVRVLRVFYYNWLWKFWGNIPYYEENLEYPYLCDQYTADEVYDFMMADLEGAIALDALPMVEDEDDYGRVTLAMAYMLYAEIVMYQNDDTRYNQALAYMEAIINSGDYSLVDDYTTIFLEEGEWSSESIFEVNYKDDNAVRSWSGPLVAGGTVLPRLLGPNAWADGTDGHDNGWGFCPVRTETYEMFSSYDTRRDATCWNAAAVGDYDPRYQDTGYFLEKYTAKTGDNADQLADADLNYNNNLRIYRYAETLLNAAELLIRGASGSGNATTYLNMVRNRAGLGDTTASLTTILNERHLEFVGEGKRYWDLVRTGYASSTLVPDDYGYRTNTWSESKKYLPIPQSEIDAAQGTLTQNDY